MCRCYTEIIRQPLTHNLVKIYSTELMQKYLGLVIFFLSSEKFWLPRMLYIVTYLLLLMVYFVREMWQYLDQVATFISNIGEVLRKMPSSEKGLVRQGLSSATRRYSSSYKRARTPRTQSKAMPFITGDDGMLLPGVYNITTSCHVTCHVITNYCRGSPLLQ